MMSLRTVVMVAGLIVSGAAHAADAPKPVQASPIPEDLGKKVVAGYAEVVRTNYADALHGAKELRAKIDAFVKSPRDATLEQAKRAWKAARLAYSKTEAFRFYGGPIDDPTNGPEGLINAWPIDEAYLDYVDGNAKAGIINDTATYPQITMQLLVEANEKNGEKNISTGFHAIEFLLWGQDLSLDGPGKRKPFDYVEGSSPVALRRAQTLKLLAELLEGHLRQVAKGWEAGVAGNYADQLLKEPLTESLRKIYTGVTSLSVDEMAGERMTVALEKSDQENEQDCFSDFTLDDAVANEVGIQQVYFGRVNGKAGVGLRDLVKAVDPANLKKTDAAVNSALQSLKAIKSPFDRVIAAKETDKNRKAARAAIAALEAQGSALAASGHKLGLILNVQ